MTSWSGLEQAVHLDRPRAPIATTLSQGGQIRAWRVLCGWQQAQAGVELAPPLMGSGCFRLEAVS